MIYFEPIWCRFWAFLKAGSIGFALCLGIAPHDVSAEDDVDNAAPIDIKLPAPNIPGGVDLRLGPIGNVMLLSDGRIGVIGNTFASSRAYVRIFDPKTGVDEIHYAPPSRDFEFANKLDRPLGVVSDSIFIYGSGATLLRAGPQSGVADPVAIHEEDIFKHLNPADPDTSPFRLRAVGSIIQDRDSVLVGWWEAASAKPALDDGCGAGAVIARVSSDGDLLWRWQDPRGGFGFPNEIAVLANGAILVLIDGEGAREDMGTMANPCVNGSKYIVALAPDGKEIARLDLPRGLAVGPLSLGADRSEALAIAHIDGAPNAILRINLEGSLVTLHRIAVPEQALDAWYGGTIVTTLTQGGYRILTDLPSELSLNEHGNVVSRRTFRTDSGMSCFARGDQAVACWVGDEVMILPLH